MRRKNFTAESAETPFIPSFILRSSAATEDGGGDAWGAFVVVVLSLFHCSIIPYIPMVFPSSMVKDLALRRIGEVKEWLIQ